MQTFNCPSCGAEIFFTSSIAVSTVCPYCRSLLVRHDKDIEQIGKMAELPPDISPFQIGTTGRYNRTGFTLVGRMKIGWLNGIWNEWFLIDDKGQKGWLAEAQGFLAISYETDAKLDEEIKQALKMPDQWVEGLSSTQENPVLIALGKRIRINRKPFKITDIKEATCIGCEGELPFIAPKGRKSIYIDMLHGHGDFAGIEIEESSNTRLFIGEYVEFNDLAFGHLRDLPGWSIKANSSNPATKQEGHIG